MSLAFSSPRALARKPAVSAAAIVVAALVAGQIGTIPNLPWYNTLAKPRFTPPNWLFGPVWTALYILTGYLYYRVARLPRRVEGRNAALTAFGALMVLNVGWNFAFFASRSPARGLGEIVVQDAALAATMALYARVDRRAAAGFLPLAAWVGFATALNYRIWRLNSAGRTSSFRPSRGLGIGQ